MALGENRIPVLLYHRIVKRNDTVGRHKIYVYEDKFYRQMKLLTQEGYKSITFEDIHYNRVSGDKNVIITFDDGYEDNYKNAFPILKEFGFKAVIFLVTRLHQNDWGIAEGEPALQMMNFTMLKEMQDYGFELGAHTQNHLDLTKASLEEIRMEVAGSKTDIEQRFGKPVLSFAYPFGGINDDIKRIVAESGFVYGISTNTGPDELLGDLMQIRRKSIGPRTTLRSFRKKVEINASGNKKGLLNFFKRK